MDFNTVAEIARNVDASQAVTYIGGAAAAKKFYDDFASPTIKSAGKLGAKIFEALTIGCDLWAESKIKRAHLLQNDIVTELKYKSPDEITSIPPEYILRPAIYQYMYSIDRDELRKMYAKLISKALLEKTKDSIHPALVNILQNLHPNEARLLNYLSHENNFPIANTKGRSSRDSSSFKRRLTYIYTYPHEIQEIQIGSDMKRIIYGEEKPGDPAYISNLARLGIIASSFIESFTNIEIYKKIENLPIVINDKKQCIKSGDVFELEKGVCRITPFGQLFIDTCIK